ncbi:MAG: four helix bundle protein [Flavobacteriales bacterium]|nr:four helix bundle protein [Flavobacteriales bacterium]
METSTQLPYDLEERLVLYASNIARFSLALHYSEPMRYYSSQLIRSSGSVALNYGEVLGTQTQKDYINKASIVLKELKESRVALKIVRELGARGNTAPLLNETEQLIKIIASLIKKKKGFH